MSGFRVALYYSNWYPPDQGATRRREVDAYIWSGPLIYGGGIGALDGGSVCSVSNFKNGPVAYPCR